MAPALGDGEVEEHPAHSIAEEAQAAEGKGEVAQAIAEGDNGAGAHDLRPGVDEDDAVAAQTNTMP
eukprot:6516916-Alexandrium_andersonii.AAC.1